MKFFISLFIFCMILFLLVFSFRYHTGESVSPVDEAGAALTDAGVSTKEETGTQMQEEETVSESQKDGTTVLDEAVRAGEEEMKKWEESSASFLHQIWTDTQESAYQMAADLSEMIYPSVGQRLGRQSAKQPLHQTKKQSAEAVRK